MKKIKNFSLFVKKYIWDDPNVKGNILAGIIVAIVLFIGSAFYGLIESLISKVPLKVTFQKFIDFCFKATPINNTILMVALIIFIVLIISVAKETLILKKSKAKNCQEETLPYISINSTSFFQNRLADAFPGQRGLKWYDNPSQIVERLAILFKDPLDFNRDTLPGIVCDPIWWYRDTSSLQIESFKKLTKTKILLNHYEYEIDKIAVNIDNAYYKCFIYLETKPSKPSGVYKFSEEEIKNQTTKFGYSYEEVGLFKNKYIKREEYEDAGIEINGKVVDASKAELRVRYLSKFNLIIAAKQSPYNSDEFMDDSKMFMDDILTGVKKPEAFFDHLKGYNKKKWIYGT